jgi:hypothetical protein
VQKVRFLLNWAGMKSLRLQKRIHR